MTPKPTTKKSPETDFEQAGSGKDMSLVKEFWLFILENKAWWLVPIIVVLGLVGILVALSQTGGAPFIYTLF